jgi:hypothetical protein
VYNGQAVDSDDKGITSLIGSLCSSWNRHGWQIGRKRPCCFNGFSNGFLLHGDATELTK